MSMFPILHTPGHGSCSWGKLWALLQLQLKPQLQTQQQTWTWPNTCPAPLWDCLGAEGKKHSDTCQGGFGNSSACVASEKHPEKPRGCRELKLEEGLDGQNPRSADPHSLSVGRTNFSHQGCPADLWARAVKPNT